ncbi:MAG TPA: hypothetical protein VMX55_10515 [candidate division Zixibacteria bacterium]|nr:hypothetical protein [candidate division Zixibacteria bacterium]
MKAILYHILAKRKLLFKTIVIIGLLSLIILTFLFPSQLATPHIISKYFKISNPITVNENLQDIYLSSPDFIFSSSAENITFIANINQICKEASFKVYNIYQPLSVGCFGIEDVITANHTTEEWTIFGINTEIYSELVSATNSSLNNLPILITDQILPCGLYRFNSSKIGNFSLNISYNLLISKLKEKLSSFYGFLENQPYRTINKSRMIFIPHKSFQTIFEIDRNAFMGYIKFTSYQEDFLYWSLDAPRKIKIFKDDLYQGLQTKEPSISFAFYQTIWDKVALAENSVLIVNIIYSFIHALQLIIWGLSGTIIFLALIKMQQSNENKEFQMLIAGKGFGVRLFIILLEDFLVVGGATIIAYSLIWPFLKLQSLFFNFPFNFSDKNIKFALIFFPVCLFLGLLIIYLDFEFHLQRVLKNSQKESENYQPFAKIPKYVRYQIILILVFLMWLLNRSLEPFLYQIAILLVFGVISGVLFLIIKGSIWIFKKAMEKNKLKHDKPLSKFALLFELWKKPINTRLLFNGFIGTLIIGLCIFSITNAEVQKTSMFYSNDFCAIKTTVGLPNNNTESIEVFLQNNSLLKEHYIKMISILHNPSENISFLHENQSITELPENYCYLYGINLTDYQRFYSSWHNKNWLLDNITPVKLNNSNAYASKNFAELGYEFGDIITLSNNQNVSIAGFLDQWIGITYPNNFNLVFESQVLEKLLLDSNTSLLEYQFRFNVEEKDIESTVEYLLNHLGNTNNQFTLSYVPPEMIEGRKIVFLYPLIMTLESLALFILAVGIYYNLTNIYSNEEARTLGILFMNTDFRKILLQMKLFEMFLSTILIATVVILIVTIVPSIIGFTGLKETIISGLGLSKNVFLYGIIIVLIYLLILVVQNGFDYLRYRKMQVHLLFRHIE